MRFWKHELPDGIMDSDEVCIGWIIFEGWSNLGWRTKRFCHAQMLPFPCEGYDKELCAAIVVKRSEMLNRGWEERESVFVKSFEWEEVM